MRAQNVRTESVTPGLLVDYDGDGVPIGLEITAPAHTTVAQINTVLARCQLPEMSAQDLAPLYAV